MKRRLIVIGIIVLIAAGAGFLVSSKSNIAKLRDIQRMEDLRNFKLSLTVYYLDNKKYPKSLQELVPNYAFEIPKDPSYGSKIKGKKCAKLIKNGAFFEYKYTLLNNEQKFILQSCLEKNDKLFLISSYE